MTTQVKLTTKQARPIVQIAFPDYAGRKFSLEFSETAEIYNTDWDGGSHNDYVFIRRTGEHSSLPTYAPWDSPVEGKRIALTPDLMVVKHTFFCGQDCGIRIYAHPSIAPYWLPERTA